MQTNDAGRKERAYQSIPYMLTMEEVAGRNNLLAALRKVRQNAGRSGNPDRQRRKEKAAELRRVCRSCNIKQLREQLISGSYLPQPVTRVKIPKGDGRFREIGIPNPMDRIVGTALNQLLSSRCERTRFGTESYAYRPGRSTDQAANDLLDYRDNGYGWILKADLTSYFDTIDHALLMEMVRQYLYVDERIQNLIERMLQAGYCDHQGWHATPEGTPQGAILSPLLSNLYGAEIDDGLRELGAHFVRYADDIAIACKTAEDCRNMLEHLKEIVLKLRLTINLQKTTITPLNEIIFLGYGFCEEGLRIPIRRIAAHIQTLKERIKQQENDDCRDTLPSIQRSWYAYYHNADDRLPTREDENRMIELMKQELPLWAAELLIKELAILREEQSE